MKNTILYFTLLVMITSTGWARAIQNTFLVDETEVSITLSNNDPVATVVANSDNEGTISFTQINATLAGDATHVGNDIFDVSSTGAITVQDDTALAALEEGDIIIIRIRANDTADSGIRNRNFWFTVTAPDAISIDTGSITHNIPENEEDDWEFDNPITASDVDGDPVWSFTLGANDTFDIDVNTGYLTLIEPDDLDFEEVDGAKQFTFDVTVADDSNSHTATITVNVLDIDEVGLLTQDRNILDDALDTSSVGSPLVHEYEAALTDDRSFVINSGDPDGIFAIDNDGQITIADNTSLAITTYNLSVTLTNVHEASGEEATATINIIVGDSSVEDLLIAQTLGPIDEDATVGVTALTVSPLTTGVTFTVAANAYFTIDSAGVLTLIGSLDYETNTSIDIEVTASKEGEPDDTETVTINVGDIDDDGVIIEFLDQERDIDENSSASTLLGDPLDYDMTFSANREFSTTDTLFDISNTGQISVAAGTSLDYESLTQHIMTVTLTDTISGENASADITIDINDLYEGSAPNIEDQDFEFQANPEFEEGDTTGLFVVASGDDIEYSKPPGGNFDINSSTGEVTILTPEEMVENAGFDFEVTVTNTVTEESVTATISIDVTAAPVVANPYTLHRKKKHHGICIVSSPTNPAYLGLLAGLVAMFLLVGANLRRKKVNV